MNAVRLCLALTAFLLTTNQSLADEVLGTWSRDNGALHVKFDTCGDAICHRWTDLQIGELEKSTLTPDRQTPFEPIGDGIWRNADLASFVERQSN
jgi:hypothetical protein